MDGFPPGHWRIRTVITRLLFTINQVEGSYSLQHTIHTPHRKPHRLHGHIPTIQKRKAEPILLYIMTFCCPRTFAAIYIISASKIDRQQQGADKIQFIIGKTENKTERQTNNEAERMCTTVCMRRKPRLLTVFLRTPLCCVCASI